MKGAINIEENDPEQMNEVSDYHSVSLVKAMEDFNTYIGRKLKHLRQAKGLSQQNVACDLGMSTTAYSKLEGGKTEISCSRIKQLADYFCVNLPDFLDISITVPRDICEIISMADIKLKYMQIEVENRLLRELCSPGTEALLSVQSGK